MLPNFGIQVKNSSRQQQAYNLSARTSPRICSNQKSGLYHSAEAGLSIVCPILANRHVPRPKLGLDKSCQISDIMLVGKLKFNEVIQKDPISADDASPIHKDGWGAVDV